MAEPAHVEIDGRAYVILARAEYDRLVALARVSELPPLPSPNRGGNIAAVAYARASIAREIVRRRAALGWTQRALAEHAGVRVETLCRIETGKTTASTATIAKVDRVLGAAEQKVARRKA